MILYRQQLLENPKFSSMLDFGWTYTGDWTENGGSITKDSGNVGTLFQSQILTHGATYKLRFRMSGRGAGTLKIQNRTGGTVHLSTTANQIHIVEFTADGIDLIFDVTNTFDGTISQATLYQTPVSYNIDLTEDVSIPLNFDIDDIFNVAKRKAPGSKTINIPGTHNNNLAFNQVYKLNAESLFNSNLKSRVVFKNSGLTVMDGDLCLDNIKKRYVNHSSEITYQTQAIGRIISIVNLLGDLTIQNLDFSEYNHVYDLLKIYNSWNDDIVINGTSGNSNTVTTYTSPAISSYTTVVVDGNNHPKITFGSAHNLSSGDEIYVPGGTDFSFDQTVLSVPSATEIILRTTKDSSFTGSLSGNVTDQQLSGFGYWYPACDYATTHNPTAHLGGISFTAGDIVLIYDYNAPDDFTNIGAASNATGVLFTVTGSGIPAAWVASSRLILYNEETGLVHHTVRESGNTTRNQMWYADDFIPHIFLKEVFQKMMAFIGIEYDLPFEDEKFWGRIIMPVDQSKFGYDSGFLIEEGDTIFMNTVLPAMKLSDVFLTVVQAFNLGAIQDADIPTKVKFVKRNTFFDNTPIDWTQKLDVSRPLDIDFLNKSLPKYYHLKYKDSEDFYNLDYNTEFGNASPTLGSPNDIDRKYGDKFLSVRSDFLKETNKVELPFEPTVLGYNPINSIINSKCFFETTSEIQLDGFTDRICERRYSPRLLFAGKRAAIWPLPISGYTTFNLITASPGRVGQIQLGIDHYPYAGHIANIDDLYPDWDLNWDTPLGTYLVDATSPQAEPSPGGYLNIDDADWGRNNLYNRNWKLYIQSITDSNSRLVKGYFKLTVIDIYSLDFSIPVRVGDYVLKLNKIIDWNLNGDGICKCEFLLKQ